MQEKSWFLLNLLLAVQFLQRPRALPAFTRLNKLDKETITCKFPETPDGLIYFCCSLFLRVMQLWYIFLIKWCESKAAAWPQEQTPQDVNSSCEYHEHQKGVVLVLLWGITLTLYWERRLPSQRLARMVTLHLWLLDLYLLWNVILSSVRFDLASLLCPAKYKVRNFQLLSGIKCEHHRLLTTIDEMEGLTAAKHRGKSTLIFISEYQELVLVNLLIKVLLIPLL